jgi:hypothetical protein
MYMNIKAAAFLFLCLTQAVFLQGQRSAQPAYPFEALINRYLESYPFSEDNWFRLAAYAELKGQYSSENQALTLSFGDLGTLTLYEKNCLLRSLNFGVHHLDAQRNTQGQVELMNLKLAQLLENILLLSNEGADTALVLFVDRCLARKNMDPFDKIFIRHLLIRYGRYDAAYRRLDFHTAWLPSDTFEYQDPVSQRLVRKPIDPMRIKLDETILRGYFIHSGGTVYVEDVQRNVNYATGEEYMPNVTAFKLFAQKLFAQTTQYIIAEEEARLRRMPDIQPFPREIADKPATVSDMYALNEAEAGAFRGAEPTAPIAAPKPAEEAEEEEVQPPASPYSPNNWIPMMLGMLRAKGHNPADRDVARYLMSLDSFPLIYEYLTPEEKRRMNRLMKE